MKELKQNIGIVPPDTIGLINADMVKLIQERGIDR